MLMVRFQNRIGDDQVVDIEVMVVFRVGDRGFEALLDVDRDALARELQVGERRRRLLAADQRRDEIELLRADAQHPGNGLRLVLAALEDAIATQHLEGMERLRQREAQDIQVMEGAVARLAGVLRPGAPLADSEGLTEKQRQLLGACNRVLAASGIAHRAPKHMPLESAAGLAAIAKEANAMTRQVTLVGPRWWERDHAPLLAYWKDTDEPVAMVPHAGGYHVYDASGAKPIKVDAAIAARHSDSEGDMQKKMDYMAMAIAEAP